jgi:hypothetical protein
MREKKGFARVLHNPDIGVGNCWPHAIARSSRLSVIDGYNSTISKDRNDSLSLLVSESN